MYLLTAYPPIDLELLHHKYRETWIQGEKGRKQNKTKQLTCLIFSKKKIIPAKTGTVYKVLI